MRSLILWLLVAAAAWAGYRHFLAPEAAAPALPPAAAIPAATRTPAAPVQTFRCDGRQHCSQMRSCEEATFVIRNCPNTKMDGDNDGVPCESQWCG